MQPTRFPSRILAWPAKTMGDKWKPLKEHETKTQIQGQVMHGPFQMTNKCLSIIAASVFPHFCSFAQSVKGEIFMKLWALMNFTARLSLKRDEKKPQVLFWHTPDLYGPTAATSLLQFFHFSLQIINLFHQGFDQLDGVGTTTCCTFGLSILSIFSVLSIFKLGTGALRLGQTGGGFIVLSLQLLHLRSGHGRAQRDPLVRGDLWSEEKALDALDGANVSIVEGTWRARILPWQSCPNDSNVYVTQNRNKS